MEENFSCGQSKISWIIHNKNTTFLYNMTKEHNDKIIYTVAEKSGGLYVQ